MHRHADARRLTPKFSEPLLFGPLIAFALLIPVYVLVRLPADWHQALYVVISAGFVLTGFGGVYRHRPARPRGWLLMLSGTATWMLGDLVWTIEQHVIPDTYPAPSDAVYLSAYLVLGAGALTFLRSRPRGRDLAALLDAAIVTVGAGVLVGVFLIAPLAADSTLSAAAKAVSSAYPLADVFLLGVIMRMYSSPGARTASYRLLTGSLIVTLLTDTSYEVFALVSDDSMSTSWTDGAWLVGNLLIAAAAIVPSMRDLDGPGRDRSESVPSRARLIGLTAGLMLPGIVLLADGATGGGVHWPVIGIGILLLSGLVLMRMDGLLNIVRVQAVTLSDLARSDSLTGAPNRRTWDHELARAGHLGRERETTLCVAMLDLDRFKAFNDTHGHQAGDRLLREAVAAWTEALTEVLGSATLLARYGGEEFAVLVTGAGAPEMVRALHRMRAVTPGGQTFSAGVAVWDPRTEPGTAVADADLALYAAKRAGRDRVMVHGQDLHAPGAEPDRLRPALTMTTQPIIDLTTSSVVGHEALARFSGPGSERGVEQVFRQAHAAGDGDLLELEAIRAALDLAGRPAGHDLYVNVSARAMTSQRFQAGLPTSLDGVVVELSEDPDGVDPAAVADVVGSLRGRGARIALDDVGAGAQEFARLASLRPDVIKVDRSVVLGCAGDPTRSAVLEALVTYANRLGVTVCAEGVEHVADLVHLAGLGVTLVQGHLLAGPGPAWPGLAAPVPATRPLTVLPAPSAPEIIG